MVLFILSLLPCGCASSNREAATTEDSIIFESEHTKVNLAEFLFYRRINYPELEGLSSDNELESFIFDKFIRDLLIAEISQAVGFRISEDQVESFITTRLAGSRYDQHDVDEQKLWRREIRRRLGIQQFLEQRILEAATVLDREVTEYYAVHQDDYRKQELYNIRFLQVASEERASAFLSTMQKSKKLFKEVAGEFAENDGHQLAIPMPLDSLLEPFRNAIIKMKPGQHSKVIPIQQGEAFNYYVLYLESVTPEKQVPLEEAYQQIQQELGRKKRQEILENKLKVFENQISYQVHPERLPFTYIKPSQRKEV